MIKVSEFKSCVNDPPKVNGEYLVARVDSRNRVYSGLLVSYTVEHGWNTRENYWEQVIEYDKDAFWAVMSYEEEPVRNPLEFHGCFACSGRETCPDAFWSNAVNCNAYGKGEEK